MKTGSEESADTRMMSIVHTALRRDLARATTALSHEPPPSDQQREALGAHLEWMMGFLHDHHAGEDDGLYPLVRTRNPAAVELLDAMSADHELIAPCIQSVRESAAEYRQSVADRTREALVSAIRALEEVLLPHLRREEDDMMPVVSRTITNAEWIEWDQAFNLTPKSFVELGREGHWLLDGLASSDRAVVVGLVPPVPRFVLLHGFARSYRRHRARCWGEPSTPRRTVAKSGRAEISTDVDADAVWDLVSDPTRVGEWSHECVAAEWIADSTEAAPGARFRGRNRTGLIRWGRVCEVVSAEPMALVWRTVPSPLYPDSSEWRITVHATADGTRIEQTFEVLKIPRLLDPVYATLIPGHRDRTAALTEDLRRLAAVAAGVSLAST